MSIAVCVTISSRERPKREIKLDVARDSDKEGNFERRFLLEGGVCVRTRVYIWKSGVDLAYLP